MKAALSKEHRLSPFRGDILICEECGYGVLSSPPSDEALNDYYRTVYWNNRSQVTQAVSVDSYATDPRAVSQLAFVEPSLHAGPIRTILEIGAGSANASLLLRDRLATTPIIHVCEPGTQWDAHYKETGIVRIAPFFPFQVDRQYEYIHTSHWLEHVNDVEGTIETLAEMLVAGGLLFVEVPNITADYWRLPGFDTPHVQFFSSRPLESLFVKRGFELLRLGEFGLTWHERGSGVHLTPDRFGPKGEGFWLRALFRKMPE